MNKICFSVNGAANYVYHMLSVAKCGYDNSHGDKYSPLYPAEDLAVLKRCEKLLTVSGGEHCGQLYWHMVCLPARGEVPVKEYYQQFRPDSRLEIYREEIEDICAVMIRNYDRFRSIYPEICREIVNYIEPLAERFEESTFTDRAEALLATALESPVFYAVMTNSMENGPEAIDISPDQDVFSITRSVEANFRFIAHEYIIFLLKSVLKDTTAFRSFHTWQITEALADYYLVQILGQTGVFSRNDRWIDFYTQLSPDATPIERYLAAESVLDKPSV